MAIQVRKGGAWRTITAAKVYKAGAWRTLVAMKVYAGGAWRTVGNFTAPPAPPPSPSPTPTPTPTGGGGTIALTLSPSPFSDSAHSSIVSMNIAATPSGGLAPYTYAWTILSATGTASVALVNSTTATVTVGATFSDVSAENISLRCTATDSLGTTAHTDVSGTLTRLLSSGGGGTP